MERMGYLEDKPNSLLGHCAGFIVAFEAALVLKKSYGYTPQRMVNIAMGPPQVRRPQGSKPAAGEGIHTQDHAACPDSPPSLYVQYIGWLYIFRMPSLVAFQTIAACFLVLSGGRDTAPACLATHLYARASLQHCCDPRHASS